MVCVDDKFSKPFKSYLSEDAVNNFIDFMIEESKYCTDITKKHFNKELMMVNMMKILKTLLRWIRGNVYVEGDVKVRDHYHIIGKYRGSAHRDCNIKVKFNHKTPIVFQNLKNYDSHLIMQELGKFDLKINIILNGSEKYMSFNISYKLSFIDKTFIFFYFVLFH